MKKSLILLVAAFMVLVSCKQKGSNTTSTTDSTKTTNGIKLPDIGKLNPGNNTNNNNPNNPTNNNSNPQSSGSWSKGYKDKFLSDCINEASKNVSASQAYSYCNCMADKVEAKYPNENEVESKLTSADIDALKPGCLSDQSNNQNNSNPNQSNPNTYNNNNNSNQGAWSSNDQQQFLNSCINTASSSIGSSRATSYCNCMLQKIMREYSTPEQAKNIPDAQMKNWATDCLR